jgi:hypothetical protein
MVSTWAAEKQTIFPLFLTVVIRELMMEDLERLGFT